MRQDSLRRRLSIWIAGLVLGVTFIAGVFAWWSATEFAFERQDENLSHLATLVAGGRLAIVPGAVASALPGDELDDEFILRVHELGRNETGGGRGSELASLGVDSPDELQTVTLEGTQWRVYVSVANAEGHRLETLLMPWTLVLPTIYSHWTRLTSCCEPVGNI